MSDHGRQRASRRTWYQVRPRTAIVVAVVLFGLVTLFHLLDDQSGQAVVVLYVLPIALLAVTFGRRGGLIGAAVGFTLFAVLEGLHSTGDIDVTGWTVRAVTMVLLGGLLGQATDRVVASQRAALEEQRERCRLEEANRRYAEAMEISDSLVQKMVAAKWKVEQGRDDEAVEVLEATIIEAEDMVAGLLAQRMTPLGYSAVTPDVHA